MPDNPDDPIDRVCVLIAQMIDLTRAGAERDEANWRFLHQQVDALIRKPIR